MKTELIVALDVPNRLHIEPIILDLTKEVNFFKVGMQLFCAEGPDICRLLHEYNARIFLDLKLHDIPNTVAEAVRSAAEHNVEFITVHASGGIHMMKAAVDASLEFEENRPQIIAVTMLTSLTSNNLNRMGIDRYVNEQALILAEMAIESGVDGLVTSVYEVEEMRKAFGDDVILITPGIRFMDDVKHDQQRVATPQKAARAGSNYIVMGRPILEADKPAEVASKILSQLTKE